LAAVGEIEAGLVAIVGPAVLENVQHRPES
jgi:hypothetical protein